MTTKLVKIGEYRFIQEAETAKMFLDEAGIPAFLEDAETVTMDWLLGNAIGYIKLTVPEDQVDRARDILLTRQENQARAKEAEGEEPVSEGKCLACGAEMGEDAEKCPACGWTWDER
jgi:ribosomal protein L40E